MTTEVARESLYLDDTGDVWLHRELGDWAEARLLGRCDLAQPKVPDHLESEYRRLLDEFNDGVAAGEEYRAEGERLWYRR